MPQAPVGPSIGQGPAPTAPVTPAPFTDSRVQGSNPPAQNLTSKHDLGARMPQAPVAPQDRAALPTVGGPAYKAPAATTKSAPMTPAATPHSAPAGTSSPGHPMVDSGPSMPNANAAEGSMGMPKAPSAPMPSANAAEGSMGMPKAPAAPAMPNSTIADDAANKTLPVALSSKNFDDRYENEKLRLAATTIK